MVTGKHKNRSHRNLFILFISFVLAFLLFKNEAARNFLSHMGRLEYLGVFLGGMFAVSTFTVAPASVSLIILAKTISIVPLVLLAGLGGMIGDVILFQFIKDEDITEDILDLFKRFKNRKITHLLHLRFFHWVLPVVGALIIISPLPDELGISLMGISKLNTRLFALLSFLFNTIWILLLISAMKLIK